MQWDSRVKRSPEPVSKNGLLLLIPEQKRIIHSVIWITIFVAVLLTVACRFEKKNESYSGLTNENSFSSTEGRTFKSDPALDGAPPSIGGNGTDSRGTSAGVRGENMHWATWRADSLVAIAGFQRPKKRTLESFLERRAFEGAPPVIPHPVTWPESNGQQMCLSCHGNGGWVEKFGAFAPITPHPQFGNCRQCHVPVNSKSYFKPTDWKPEFRHLPTSHAVSSYLPGGPPKMPHPIQMRENCLACHGGPHAVDGFRTPHPERPNCAQCHVPSSSIQEFARPGRRE